MKLRVFLAFALLMFTSDLIHGNEYFFDSQMGSDENPGNSTMAPFRSLAKLATIELDPGDVVRFKKGCTFRGRLSFRGNGTEADPILLTAYGDGPKPEILGSIQLTEWTRHAGTVYKHVVPVEQFVGKRTVYSIYEYDQGKVPVRLLREDAVPAKRGRFFFDEETWTVYLTTSDGALPSQHRIEVSVIEQLVDFTDRSWIKIEELTFLFGNCRHIVVANSQQITLRRCASLFVGFYGNPNVLVLRDSTRIQLIDCFLYENANCGIFISSGSNRCLVSGCTIVKCQSNDGVTIHSGGRDKHGIRQGLAGDYNVLENNVIGLCPEESIDITSGDHHIIRGNICYGNGNPGIIVGHDSDHILIQNNISFGNARSGIHIAGNEQEGARGSNRVLQNLVYDNGYPGIEIQGKDTEVLNNTIVDSRERVGVRINPEGHGSELRNNLVVTMGPAIGHANLQFLGGTPATLEVQMSHNIFYHCGLSDDALLVTSEGSFSPATFLAQYGTGEASSVAKPRFAYETEFYYFLTPNSPAVNAGTDVMLPFAGEAPDVGWKELGYEATAPRYPPSLIDGEDDQDWILYLWGKVQR
jgi:parallel beta-helix repeat protein